MSARLANANLYAWINAYRQHGHRACTVDAIQWLDNKERVPELEIARYGLDVNQAVTRLAGIVSFNDSKIRTIGDLRVKLNEAYCDNVSAEFSFIDSEFEREWFTENYEKMIEEKVTDDEKRTLAMEMLKFQELDRFMNVKMPAIKRYGGEGAEGMVAFFGNLLRSAANSDASHIVLGMPHRGKLNSLATIFKHRPARIFRKYRGLPEFQENVKAMMDIPNHFCE